LNRTLFNIASLPDVFHSTSGDVILMVLIAVRAQSSGR